MIKFNTRDHKCFFTSDLHINHKNICYGISKWSDKETSTRRFDTLTGMNNCIIDNINKTVEEDDILFLLGDLLFQEKSIDNYKVLLEGFNCNNIYLLHGNHDNRLNLTHAYIESLNKVKSLTDYLEISIDGKLICMSHYPMARWNNRHNKSSYMLFGHEHGMFDNGENSIDVGIDNYFKLYGEYKPFSWNELKSILK